MPRANWARRRVVWGIVVVGLLAATWRLAAQTAAPPPPDGVADGPVRERRLVQRLENARQLLKPVDPKVAPDFAQGLRVLQAILDGGREDDEAGAEDVFLDGTDPTQPDQPVRSLRSEARGLIGHLPAEGRQTYETLFGKTAQVSLEAAQAQRDWGSVEEVARKWFHTSAGYSATLALAMRNLDAGEPLAATRRLEELRDVPHTRRTLEPLLSLRLAVAWRLAGRDDRAQQVLIEWKQAWGDRPVEPRDGGAELPLFARDEDALSWLDRWLGTPLLPLRATHELPHEWPLVLGSVGRNALASAAIPGDEPAWSRHLLEQDATSDRRATSNDEPQKAADQSETTTPHTTEFVRGWAGVRTLIDETIADRTRAEQPLLPALQPIVVGDAVVVRTLSQLRAYRISDGKLLWQSASADSHLSDLLRKSEQPRTRHAASQELETWVHQRVWDDAVSGSLSSDGELVFSLNERSSSLNLSPQVAWRGMLVPEEYNTLSAIEARTGRLRWEIGGPHGEQELLGAGSYFLGPPLPWRGELFVLSDDRVDVRLLVLDARDGRLLWTQTLGPSDPLWGTVIRDTGLSPTVIGDCVLCPTGAGTIVAVDPVRRELRWQATYRAPTDRVPRRRFDFNWPHAPIEAWWQNSVLPTVRDRVVAAIPDHVELLCLDVTDGRVLWRQPRGEGLFVAGVTDDAVLVVGRSEVRALRLDNGEPAWPQPATIAAPLGRGVLIENVLHLPVMSHGGEVVSIDTRNGRLLARTPCAQGLGNLIAANGQLVSQSATQVAAFSSLSDLQREIAQSLAQNPDNARALEQRGQMQLHLGRRQQGLTDLRRAVALKPTADNKRLLAELLLEELRTDGTEIDATMRELDTLVDDPRQRLTVARLKAQRLQQRGQTLESAREFLKLADAWEPTDELETFGNSAVRADRWIAARLAEVRPLLSPSDRQTFDEELQTRLKVALAGEGASPLRRFLRLFGWSDAATAVRRALCDRLDAKKHAAELEAALLALRHGGSAELQAFATARLAQHWLALAQEELARPLLDDLSGRFAAVPCLDGKTGREWLDRWQSEQPGRWNQSWPAGELQPQADLSDAPLERSIPVEWASPPDEFHRHWKLELDTSRRTLVARDGSGQIQWRLKLVLDEASPPLMVGNSAIWRGRWLVLLLGDRFVVADTLATDDSHDLSPRLVRKGVLFDPRLESAVTLQPQQRSTPIDGTPISWMLTDTSGRRMGRATIIGHDILCVQNGSRLIASELRNGDVVWGSDGIPSGCELSADDQTLLACPPDGREVLVFHALDGRLLARRELKGATRVAPFQRHVLTWSRVGDEHELRLFDPLANSDVLKERFNANAKPSVSLQDTVGVVEPSGRFALWSLADGQKLLDQTVPAIEHLRHVLVLRDRERWLLLTYTEEPGVPGQPRPRITELYFDQWKVHGPCFAFERATGKLAWTAKLDWQGVNAAQPAEIPVLLLAAKVTGQVNLEKRSPLGPNVAVLDKRNGKVLPLNEDWPPSPYQHFTELRAAPDRTTLEVQIDRKIKTLTFKGAPKAK